MLEKNYKLAEMIFLEQVMGEERPDGRVDQRWGKKDKLRGGKSTGQLDFQKFSENF